MGEILAMNVPVITNPGWGDVEEIVQEAGVLLYPEKMEDVLANVGRNKAGREYCNRKLSLSSGVAAYDKIYKCNSEVNE
jgi:hypothetical protein